MPATICRDEAIRIGSELALLMLHRPGWGWSLSYPGERRFHATVTTPEVHRVGQTGQTFAGQGDTPSQAIEAAFMASASHAAHAVRRPEPVR